MLHISGYHLTEQIAENAHCLIYRAYSDWDNQPVILKLPAESAPSPEQLARFQREYDLLRSLNAPGVIRCYRLGQAGQRPVLVLEDFGGTALNQLGVAGHLEPADFLRMAITIATSIGQVHRAQMIHKDITPGNLVYNPATGQLKLIDFSLATRLRREEVGFQSPSVLEGTLAYISPEQTGRMNRAVDYRTDLYSLGVTLYELLTGQRPFASDNPLELVHAHLARLPQPPHQFNPRLPAPLSAIIMKLLAKNAEDRYQSAEGLVADLEYCLEHLDSPASLAAFTPGRNDRAERFQIPQALYGREAEVARLLATFERVATGGRELLLVAGASGVGKTVLVHEIHKPVTARRGYFIAGKFDQYQRTIPYLAWVRAFTGLVYQLLTESEAQREAWRTAIQAAVGANGRLVTDVIPNLELIIGPQPAVPLLEGREAQHRFEFVFRSFIKALAQPHHPLVVFLDDLQWADSASLHMMELLLTEAGTGALLVIGAYRDTEVAPAHPLLATIADLPPLDVTVTTLTLAPLSQADMNQLIADTLSCPAEMAQPLTQLVYQKTHGSPFFTTQFLHALHDERLLTFNAASGQWQCDLAQVRTLALTDDAVTFMAQQVQKLPPDAQTLLMLAACIGNQFDLATLALVAEQSPIATAADFWHAVQVGLVMTTSEIYQFAHAHSQGAARPMADRQVPTYRFLHDQVRQAAYSLIPDDQKSSTHLRIGRLLLQQTPDTEQHEALFEIVHQFNRGTALLVEPEERTALARLNLLAGQKAKAATAYGAARDYFTAARQLLPEDSWQRHYALTLQLYESSVEAAYLSGDFDQTDRLTDVVLSQATTIFDQVKVYDVKSQALVAQNKLVEAVNTGLQFLVQLGVAVPQQPSQQDVFVALQEAQAAYQEPGIAALINLPLMNDPMQLAAMRILSSILAAAYLTSPELYAVLTAKEINLSIKYGNTPISTHSYASYGLILCGVLGDIEAGYQFGQLALDLLHRLDAREFHCKVYSIVHAFIAHWKDSIKNMLAPLRSAYYSGLETGDLQFAGYSAVLYSAFAYFGGIEKNLAELQREAFVLSESIHQVKQITAFQYFQMLHQAVHDLIEGRSSSKYLQGAYYDEETLLPRHIQANDRNGIFYLYCHKLLLNYLFGEYQQAVEEAANTEQYLDGATGFPYVPLFYCYDLLARLAAYREAPHGPPDELLLRIEASQEKMKTWAHSAPMNWLHRWELVEAERQRVFGDQWKASEHYDRAIAGAQEHGSMREAALANELAATFYLDWGKEKVAQTYMQDAYDGYARWGAAAKTAQLEQRYARLLAPMLAARIPASDTRISRSSTTSTMVGASLDLFTVIKASQAIAGEIELAPLLRQLMRIVIENAGAQRGALILERGGEWAIEAQGDVDSQEIAVAQAHDLRTSAAVAAGIVAYVARTCDSVVLNDAAGEGPFTSDPYIRQHQTKSVLCTPLINQGRVSGILYLENNLATGAFIPSRVELLKLLSAQMAMSLDNARIYANLEAKVVERTQELAKAKEAAEQANDLKTRFLASMSHELRTPLNVINGYAELLLTSDNYGPLSDPQRQRLERVHANGEHLLGLINDILDLSKIEAGRMDLAPEDINLVLLMKSVMSTAIGLTQNKSVEIILDVPEDLPLPVRIDGKRIRQVLLNLLSNAAKFTEEGSITLQAQPQDDGTIRVSVRDTGIGIAPEHLALIFEEFRQADSDLARAYQGTGLGLPISKGLVEMHGGTMWVESTPGVGSTFSFTLPMAQQVPAQLADAAPLGKRGFEGATPSVFPTHIVK